MKKLVLGALLCGVIGVLSSGCNNSEPTPVSSSAPTTPGAAAGTPGNPGGAVSNTAPNGGAIPANAPSGIQKQMQMMGRGGGGPMGRPQQGGYGGSQGYGGR